MLTVARSRGHRDQDQPPEQEGHDREGDAVAAVLEEPDLDACLARRFHHDEIGDRAENRQVPGKRRLDAREKRQGCARQE